MFHAKIEPHPEKRMVPQRFSPASLKGCVRSATDRTRAAAPQCPRSESRIIRDALQGCATAIPQNVRHHDIFFWEMLHPRTLFCDSNLSHKSGSIFFQKPADSIDKKRRAAYVLEHRMRTACVSFRSAPDASFF
jgi:hypothetical protein